MSDIELLKLAAKAAWIEFEWHPGCGNALRLIAEDASAIYWNPLLDDGDALRLAVKLRINIEHIETQNRVAYGINCWPHGRGDCAAVETEIDDYCAATRRAIVRAAAEIGRAAKGGAA